MDDSSINNKKDFLEGPEIGPMGPAPEAFHAPRIEQPSAGVIESPSKPLTKNSGMKVDPIRAALAKEVERTRAPFDMHPEVTAQMMEDNEKALEKTRKPVIVVQEHPFTGLLRLAGQAIRAVMRRK